MKDNDGKNLKREPFAGLDKAGLEQGASRFPAEQEKAAGLLARAAAYDTEANDSQGT